MDSAFQEMTHRLSKLEDSDLTEDIEEENLEEVAGLDGESSPKEANKTGTGFSMKMYSPTLNDEDLKNRRESAAPVLEQDGDVTIKQASSKKIMIMKKLESESGKGGKKSRSSSDSGKAVRQKSHPPKVKQSNASEFDSLGSQQRDDVSPLKKGLAHFSKQNTMRKQFQESTDPNSNFGGSNKEGSLKRRRRGAVNIEKELKNVVQSLEEKIKDAIKVSAADVSKLQEQLEQLQFAAAEQSEDIKHSLTEQLEQSQTAQTELLARLDE